MKARDLGRKQRRPRLLKAPWNFRITIALAHITLQLALNQAASPSCVACFGQMRAPVCTSVGVTLPTSCLATCQGLTISQNGICHESDPLIEGIRIPLISEWTNSASNTEAGSVATAKMRTRSTTTLGSSSSSSTDNLIDNVVSRFSDDGFVYAGIVGVTAEGPDNPLTSGFVSKLTRESPAAAPNSPISATPSSSGRRSSLQHSSASPLRIRGVRVAADGAVYLESVPLQLDPDDLLHSGATAGNRGTDAETGATGGQPVTGSTDSGDAGVVGTLGARIPQLLGKPAAKMVVEDDMGLSGGSAQEQRGRSEGRRRWRRQLVDDSYRADVMSWPHNVIGRLVYVSRNVSYVCSGSWISPYDVLTAAHCVFDLVTKTESRDFTFETGRSGVSNTSAIIKYNYYTFYRFEYARVNASEVDYFDLALIRMATPTVSYMGMKYSCDQTDYSKTQACGYRQVLAGFDYQTCDDCYYTNNGCNLMVQPVNWCYTARGQSGGPIYDLTDFSILGVLSGGRGDLSYWTPIDAFHLATLTRWMWRPGQPGDTLPVSPPPPPPPPRSLSCATEETSRVRLVDSNIEGTGRAEICLNGTWSPICLRSDNVSANVKVICRQLGYPSGAPLNMSLGGFLVGGESPGQRFGMVASCSGTESSLSDCRPLNSGFVRLTSPCVSSFMVNCIKTSTGPTLQTDYTRDPYPCNFEGAVRLQDTGDPSWGRVEVCYAGQWGSVCHDSWDDADATVVCRQLGYPYGIAQKGAVANGLSPPGPDSMRVWMQLVDCAGSEPGLSACPSRVAWGATNCGHRADAGAACYMTPPDTIGVAPITEDQKCSLPGALRIVPRNGSVPNAGSDVSGRLEVCYGGQWGAVCSDTFDNTTAAVACRQMGFRTGRAVPAAPRPRQPIWMSDIMCGTTGAPYEFWQARLTLCSFWGMEDVSCTFGTITGVHCYFNDTFQRETFPCSTSGELRLADGNATNIGRLELCYGGRWGTVCDSAFGTADADVACRQLGYSQGLVLTGENVTDGHPDSPIWMSSLRCLGTERRLVDCLFSGWSNHTCDHGRDAGVICQKDAPPPRPPFLRFSPPPPPPNTFICTNPGRIRLLDSVGRSMYDTGRLEICLDGLWGTVCGRGFSQKEALVACRHFGFVTGVVVPIDAFGIGSGRMPVNMHDVRCGGGEQRLTACQYVAAAVGTCTHTLDVAVKCFWAIPSPPQPPPRLPPSPPQPPPRLPPSPLQPPPHLPPALPPPRPSLPPPTPPPVSPLQPPPRFPMLFSHLSPSQPSPPPMPPPTQPSLPPSRPPAPPSRPPPPPSHPPSPPPPPSPTPPSPTPPSPTPPSPTPPSPTPPSPTPPSPEPPQPSPPQTPLAQTPPYVSLPLSQSPPLSSQPPIPTQTTPISAPTLPNSFTLSPMNSAPGSTSTSGPPSQQTSSLPLTPPSKPLQPMGSPLTQTPPQPQPPSPEPRPPTLPHLSPQLSPLQSPSVLFTPPPPPQSGTPQCDLAGGVRLTGGLLPGSGMLQYCSDNGTGVLRWGSVCGNNFKLLTAKMVCRQLGYRDGFQVTDGFASDGLYYSFPPNPVSTPVWFDTVKCPLNATTLAACTSVSPKCTSRTDVALACLNSTKLFTRYGCSRANAIRLVAGPTPNQGTLQVCRNSYWGTVCDEGWDDVDAGVVCRQLNYTGGLAVNGRGRSANGTSYGPYPSAPTDMPVWLSDAGCKAAMKRLDLCTSGLPTQSCLTHSQDAGAVCWMGGA